MLSWSIIESSKYIDRIFIPLFSYHVITLLLTLVPCISYGDIRFGLEESSSDIDSMYVRLPI